MSDGHNMATIIETSKGTPKRHILGEITTLGRGPDNSIRFDNVAVSGNHAVIRRRPDGEFILEDLGTTNGSFVGSDRVSMRVLLDGDTVTLGNVSFLFSTGLAVGTPCPERKSRRKSPSSNHRKVRMRVSEEMSIVHPTWEMQTLAESDFFDVDAESCSGVSLRHTYDRLLAAYDLIHSIIGADDLSEILNRIVNAVIDLMDADRAVVLLVGADGKLVPRVALQKIDSNEEFQVSTSILNYVVENGCAVVCNDLESDQRFSAAQSLILQNVRSAMCVPMKHDGQLVGVLHMDSTIATGAFEGSDLEVIRTIANTAAFCVKTAMLKETMQEMQRQQSEAMLAMICGASHFINNPLAVIRSNAFMFEEWSQSIVEYHQGIQNRPSEEAALREQHGIDYIDEELGSMAAETGTSANRIASIVQALHMFEQKSDPADWSEFDVAEVIKEVAIELKEDIAQVAQIHLQLEPAAIRGIRNRISLLIKNLLINAQQSIAPGSAEKNWVVASCHVAKGKVVVTIDDTGKGVPAKKRFRIFAPFDTDRLDGSLGLGLAVSSEIARQHEASLRVSPREGGGSRFLVELPAASQPT